MIRVTIYRNSEGLIERFAIKGHANYAPHGEDIVCAGVSAVSVGVVNAIEALTGVALECQMKDGFLNGTVPVLNDAHCSEQVQLLLESMVVSLNTMEDSYGSYIQIKENNSKRR
ncbi:ribosomal-processing cysteine protease Prp [Paenibacillus arenosi]|uniref:Ribosomal processing cysteine protease Prp n=1 Tax=Paenibacillus arenosi TaxID=2774142 RepID=A0ABR9B366_9BACL|nr:ribosomal-processing cysteine protease Prp [Paenibacillus arenosi]MBD8500774.1 ribosomal-processing cysteine protease Prp [Paenibacillus arenosi]